MRKYVFIAFGGAIGAMARFSFPHLQAPENFPIRTLLINVIGCFLIGVILTFATEVRFFDTDVRMGITTGVLGAFTTFSTVAAECVQFIAKGQFALVFFYVMLSAMIGFIAVYAGYFFMREVELFLKKKEVHELKDEVE
ncbi:MAG: fluoride efflux transporter CrcB [Clostridia bacterium]